MLQDPYLPTVDVVDTLCGLPEWPGGLALWALCSWPGFPIYFHANISGHDTKVDNFSIAGRESNNIARTIKVTMLTRVNDPLLYKNIGK